MTTNPPTDMFPTWICEICREEKPDAEVTVTRVDLSPYVGLPADTWRRNILHCRTCDPGPIKESVLAFARRVATKHALAPEPKPVQLADEDRLE